MTNVCRLDSWSGQILIRHLVKGRAIRSNRSVSNTVIDDDEDTRTDLVIVLRSG
jgi:hypothetical protein